MCDITSPRSGISCGRYRFDRGKHPVLLLVLAYLLIGEWWARSIVPKETKAITVLNQHGAYHPWAGYRNTPGFRYEDLGNWVPVFINSWGWRG